MPSNRQHSALDDPPPPPELLQQILSLLNIPTLKWLSLASSLLRAVCFPYVFRSVFLYGPTCTFVADFKGRALTRMHMIGLTWIMEDLSASLLPWCAKVHIMKISSCNVRNTAIIPSLSILRDLELLRLTFWVVEDYFSLLENLPPTLKKQAVHGIKFRFDNLGADCYATVRRAVDLEHLDAHLGEDLPVLLRDDCPISLESLRVAYVPQCRPHDLEDLLQRAPHLIDLRLDIGIPEDRPVSLPLTRLKALSVSDGTELSDTHRAFVHIF
ncbi:hypothetical protein EV421DRAFT_1911473 [Armillaria borealis]|uniref:F-box domain-containing protein n=1 Tax=Armillaria borealis TaxID=47425 RepID=A0AA39MEF8_9AGAR|nr:hypothetical protein EV421DRAFT_1911473 [Armillaria borealis]